MSNNRARLLGFAFALLLASALPLLALSTQRPALDVRAVPRQLPAGKIFAGHAFGQTFKYPAYELSRIEVLLVRQPGESSHALRLTLREGGPTGRVLHTVESTPAASEPGPQFIEFEFPPRLYASGGTYHFAIGGSEATGASDWSPWISWRGRSGAALPWGDHTVGPNEATLTVKSLRDKLAAVALAVDGLNVPAGTCLLEVREAGREELLRTGELQHNSPIAGGYALFSFDPIADSRWREYDLRFVLPQDARVVAGEQGLSTISLHGAAPATESLLGMTQAGHALPHRDLIFRASGKVDQLGRLTLLFERIAWPKLFIAWLLSWIAGGLVLAFFLREFCPEPTAPH